MWGESKALLRDARGYQLNSFLFNVQDSENECFFSAIDELLNKHLISMAFA